MRGARPAYLLDTSALLTLIEDENGAERVEQVLIHKDPEFDTLAGEVALEALPFKRRAT